MDDFTQLKVGIADFVATLTLDSPPVNALTRVLNDELTLALDRLSEMDEVRAVVLTGAGKVFCAGADLKGRAQMIQGPGDLPAHSRRTRECFHAIRECAKPVVVAINGAALGSGVAMVASADILVACDKASLACPRWMSACWAAAGMRCGCSAIRGCGAWRSPATASVGTSCCAWASSKPAPAWTI